LAKALSGAALICISCILLVVVSLVFYHVRTHGNPLWALPPLLVGIAAFTAIGVALGGTIPAEGAAAVTNAIYLPLLFLGGTFVPIDKLPTPLRDLALTLPPAHLVSALNSVLVLGHAATDTGWDIPIIAAWGAAALAIASRRLRWE
jgi:ABC-2 type transport system permease protein